jgi:hypothetical protein
MENDAASYFELLGNRDLILQRWKSENQSKKEVAMRRKAQFLLALKSFSLLNENV